MGAKFVDSPKEVGANSDVVISIVGYPSDVRSVILDEERGVLSGMKSGSVIIDMTTSEPSLAVDIFNKAKNQGVYSLDAPCRYVYSVSFRIFVYTFQFLNISWTKFNTVEVIWELEVSI